MIDLMNDVTFQRAINLLQTCDIQWAVCGGWAIDLYLDQQMRDHKDLDVTIKRSDQLHMQSFLLSRGWTLQKVDSGELHDWEQGEYLNLPIHNVWCSHPNFPPNYLEILFSEAHNNIYKFRRNPQIQLPLDRAFIPSASNIPILAPEIVLLFKAKTSDTNPSYQHDFEVILPLLTTIQREWLRQAIQDTYGNHHWLNML